jgi:hypothetical protein
MKMFIVFKKVMHLPMAVGQGQWLDRFVGQTMRLPEETRDWVSHIQRRCDANDAHRC